MEGWADWCDIQLRYPMLGDAKLSNCPPLVCLQEVEVCGERVVKTMRCKSLGRKRVSMLYADSGMFECPLPNVSWMKESARFALFSISI